MTGVVLEIEFQNPSQSLPIPLSPCQSLSVPLSPSQSLSVPLNPSQSLSVPLSPSQSLSVPLSDINGCARGGGIGSIQRALELVYVVPGTVSVSNQHVISIHAQNDELFIGLEGMGRTFAEQNLLFPRESQRSWPCTFSFAYQ
jgi:hypothetical protein